MIYLHLLDQHPPLMTALTNSMTWQRGGASVKATLRGCTRRLREDLRLQQAHIPPQPEHEGAWHVQRGPGLQPPSR